MATGGTCVREHGGGSVSGPKWYNTEKAALISADDAGAAGECQGKGVRSADPFWRKKVITFID
jgi:hypothetical protein